MSKRKKDETASFVIRFTQKIFQQDSGESDIQWRGNIRHVQGGDEKRFSKFDEVVDFVQEKLADLTITAMEDKSPEEQKNILEKSFGLWKKMAMTGPKMVMDTIKDPKKQIAHLQQQINEVGESIGQRFEIDVLKKLGHNEFEELFSKMDHLADRMSSIEDKIDSLSKEK